jgi:hypothetical protein
VFIIDDRGLPFPLHEVKPVLSRLEKTTHAFLILVSAAALTMLGRQYLMSTGVIARPASAYTAGSRATPGYARRISRVGDKIALANARYDWRSANITVVLVIASDCIHCKASLPFYTKLVQTARAARPRVDILVVSPEDLGKTRAFLASAGIVVDQFVNSDLESLGTPGTPTIFLVDAAGIIRERLVGELKSGDQTVLLASLASPDRLSPKE